MLKRKKWCDPLLIVPCIERMSVATPPNGFANTWHL